MPAMAYTRHVVDEATGCWEWQGHRARNGYGKFYDAESGHVVLAHRAYYERHISAIPVGLQIDHLCRNRGCVNPEHLEVVEQTENVRRGSSARFTPADVRMIRESPKSSYELARELDCDPSWLTKIRRREAWKDVA